MPHKICSSILIATLTLISVLSLTSCGGGGNTNLGGSSNGSSSPAPSPKSGFEADLDYVRKGQYTYVLVFSRKDGKPLDKDDGAFLRTNAPQVVDWVTSDEGKKVIAGTNFDLAKGNLELLKKRFNAEDYSGR